MSSSPASAPRLVLLNGPPGAGKSTLATELARRHRAIRALDVDVVKHALPSWPSDRQAAGLRARELILEEARPLLAGGTSVVIGQYLARPAFPEALAALADETEAPFVHVVLTLPPEVLEQRLQQRRLSPTRAEQAANDARVDPAEAAGLIESVEALACGTAGMVRIDASGDLATTLAGLEQVLGLSRRAAVPSGQSARRGGRRRSRCRC